MTTNKYDYKIIKKVTKAVIPAAGLGTRVLSSIKVLPKEMLTIVDKFIAVYSWRISYFWNNRHCNSYRKK